MGSGKHEELREDIQNCFKLCNKIEAKYDAKFDSLKEKQGDYATDVKLLAKSVENLASITEGHRIAFEKHNDEEMKNYEQIQDNQKRIEKTMLDLKSSIDVEIKANEARDIKLTKQGQDIDKMKNIQGKFLRWSAYIVGGFATLTFLYKLGIISINLGG